MARRIRAGIGIALRPSRHGPIARSTIARLKRARSVGVSATHSPAARRRFVEIVGAIERDRRGRSVRDDLSMRMSPRSLVSARRPTGLPSRQTTMSFSGTVTGWPSLPGFRASPCPVSPRQPCSVIHAPSPGQAPADTSRKRLRVSFPSRCQPCEACRSRVSARGDRPAIFSARLSVWNGDTAAPVRPAAWRGIHRPALRPSRSRSLARGSMPPPARRARSRADR